MTKIFPISYMWKFKKLILADKLCHSFKTFLLSFLSLISLKDLKVYEVKTIIFKPDSKSPFLHCPFPSLHAHSPPSCTRCCWSYLFRFLIDLIIWHIQTLALKAWVNDAFYLRLDFRYSLVPNKKGGLNSRRAGLSSNEKSNYGGGKWCLKWALCISDIN